VLDQLEARGIPLELRGVDRLIAACARGHATEASALATAEPALLGELHRLGGGLLGRFSATGNAAGVRQLLDLGVDVRTPWAEGDGYFGIPAGSLAIHVASWCCCTDVVRLLIERGTPVDVPNAQGETPLRLAVRACVDSYWTEYCSPALLEALIAAGAAVEGIPYPVGHPAVDAVLGAHRR
jgi:hypothetical protein